MGMPFIIRDFDEYDQIIDPKRHHDHLEMLIDSSFEENELIVCIIESVTIGNLQGIGTTHLRYIEKPEDHLRMMIDEYWAIVEQLKDEFPNISSYLNWYQRSKSIMIAGKNPSSKQPSINRFTWKDKIVEKKPCFQDYISIRNQELTYDEIQAYLSRYIELLGQKEWFASLPYYTIIAKPISVYDDVNAEYIPLGNLYLHFGTRVEKDVQFYKKLMNNIMLIWFKKNGAKMINELHQKKQSDAEKPLSDRHIPRFTEARHQQKLHKTKVAKMAASIKLIDLYRYAFDNQADPTLFNGLLIDENHDIFNLLNKVLQNGHDYKSIVDDFKERCRPYSKTSLEGITKLDENCKTAFLKILSNRRIALSLLLIYRLSIQETHKLITARQNDNSPSDKSIINFLWNKLFIPYRETDKRAQNLGMIASTLSQEERKFVWNLHERVVSDCPQFNYPFLDFSIS